MQERRKYQRLVPDSPLFVRVGDTRRGPVLDLSEGGLAFGGIVQNSAFSMVFDLPDGNGAIEARGEIAWTNKSGAITGIRFVELADDYRRRLKNWISSRAYPEGELVDLTAWPVSPLQIVSSDAFPKASSPASSIQISGMSKLRAIEIILSALILCSAFVCIGYYLPNIGGRSNGGNEAEAPSVAASASPKVVFPESASNPGKKSLPPRLSLDVAGYVVQVAAMTHEDNADALAAILNQKSFPAFVFKRDGDRFYRVAVGPFGDENATIQVKEQIETQGFKTMLRTWSPE